mmetsp:Transcript_11967/g.28783  ORF Transcript_11967/g.28783 Transcript_11967/m.28783 type:complete len:880 (-) Transcript_11967:2786-5425(-)|eukprot:CAMPEP_0113469718 /NCGR_PEP_ID=MMETSP0014_2-20120614/16049_1 /TAXON_ID=2857 /ORGANISM="Nitzschia sp." /LENGTH=879 /DNA_ID=CAMNT_0000362215 /DNA_START=356 /DNA_END=2995 /DNA_ORIENTATION=+ /assembly_acc=CAM_ASM_000159
MATGNKKTRSNKEGTKEETSSGGADLATNPGSDAAAATTATDVPVVKSAVSSSSDDPAVAGSSRSDDAGANDDDAVSEAVKSEEATQKGHEVQSTENEKSELDNKGSNSSNAAETPPNEVTPGLTPPATNGSASSSPNNNDKALVSSSPAAATVGSKKQPKQSPQQKKTPSKGSSSKKQKQQTPPSAKLTTKTKKNTSTTKKPGSSKNTTAAPAPDATASSLWSYYNSGYQAAAEAAEEAAMASRDRPAVFLDLTQPENAGPDIETYHKNKSMPYCLPSSPTSHSSPPSYYNSNNNKKKRKDGPNGRDGSSKKKNKNRNSSSNDEVDPTNTGVRGLFSGRRVAVVFELHDDDQPEKGYWNETCFGTIRNIDLDSREYHVRFDEGDDWDYPAGVMNHGIALYEKETSSAKFYSIFKKRLVGVAVPPSPPKPATASPQQLPVKTVPPPSPPTEEEIMAMLEASMMTLDGGSSNTSDVDVSSFMKILVEQSNDTVKLIATKLINPVVQHMVPIVEPPPPPPPKPEKVGIYYTKSNERRRRVAYYHEKKKLQLAKASEPPPPPQGQPTTHGMDFATTNSSATATIKKKKKKKKDQNESNRVTVSLLLAEKKGAKKAKINASTYVPPTPKGKIPNSIIEDERLPKFKSGLRLAVVENGLNSRYGPVAYGHCNKQQWGFDEGNVNPLHCYVRKELIEVVVLGRDFGYRVGLRCVFCGPLPKSERNVFSMSQFFPKSVEDMYRCVCTWQRIHFPHCKHVPEHMKIRYRELKQISLDTRGRKQYWIESAKALGMRNMDHNRSGVYLAVEEMGGEEAVRNDDDGQYYQMEEQESEEEDGDDEDEDDDDDDEVEDGEDEEMDEEDDENANEMFVEHRRTGEEVGDDLVI